VPQKRIIHAARGWDLHLAPLLLALTWRQGGSGMVPIVDLWGTKPGAALHAAWTDGKGELAGQPIAIDAGPDGSLLRIRDAASGAVVLSVEGRSVGAK
jgi:hypothetical protein